MRYTSEDSVAVQNQWVDWRKNELVAIAHIATISRISRHGGCMLPYVLVLVMGVHGRLSYVLAYQLLEYI